MRLPSVEQAELGVGPAVSARFDPFGECPHRLLAADAAHGLACHVATADVDGDGVAAAEGLLHQPVWCGWPGGDAALPLLLAVFFVSDPPPGAVEVGLLYAFEEAQHVEPRWR